MHTLRLEFLLLPDFTKIEVVLKKKIGSKIYKHSNTVIGICTNDIYVNNHLRQNI
jgi:hypothetical protein